MLVPLVVAGVEIVNRLEPSDIIMGMRDHMNIKSLLLHLPIMLGLYFLAIHFFLFFFFSPFSHFISNKLPVFSLKGFICGRNLVIILG
jgi:hypothetical protein